MKRQNWLLIYLFVIIPFTCCDGKSENIIDDFTFWESGLESTANIGYRSQAIIDTTAYVVDYWNNDRFIVARTYWYKKKPTDDLESPNYVYIDIAGYMKEPNKLKSSAVHGPITLDSLRNILNMNNVKIGNSLERFLSKQQK